MVYCYACPCGHTEDVIKSVKDFDRTEFCKCGTAMKRQVSRGRIYFSGASVQEKKFQPALGRAATDSELRRVAKEKGWIECGNERPEKHLKPELSEYPTFTSDEIRALTSKP